MTTWQIKVKWSAGHRLYFAWARPKTFRGRFDSLKISPQHRLLGAGNTADAALTDVKRLISTHGPTTGTGKYTYDVR